MGNIPSSPRASVYAGHHGALEKTRLTFGIMSLTDCAVLAVAREKDFFAKYDLDVELSKEASWANIRDKVAVGALDGAHMLAGMPIASSLGASPLHVEMLTAFSLGLNGNAITVSESLYQRMQSTDPVAMQSPATAAQALKRVIDSDAGKPTLTFAHVYPFSSHNYELRYWLAAAGIDPDNDVRLVVIPPAQMVTHLKEGTIDGYCVGEPWNERAVKDGIGHSLITSYEFWNNKPEKVFGVTREWAKTNPNTHLAVLMALLEAAAWADDVEHRQEVAEILCKKYYVDAPLEVVSASLNGAFKHVNDQALKPLPDFNVFYRYAATFPWISHAEWFISQMYRWGQIDRAIDIKKAAAEIYRPDLYRQAAEALGREYPHADYKQEGVHNIPWNLAADQHDIIMGQDLFFDGSVFDPDRIVDYIAGFEIENMQVDIGALKACNGAS